MTAPSSASVGDKVKVTAKNLKKGKYTVRLYAVKVPNKNWACAATIAAAKRSATSSSVSGKIPAKVGCYSGFPSSSEGSIKVKPGAFKLVVSVPNGPITTAPGSSVATRSITIK